MAEEFLQRPEWRALHDDPGWVGNAAIVDGDAEFFGGLKLWFIVFLGANADKYVDTLRAFLLWWHGSSLWCKTFLRMRLFIRSVKRLQKFGHQRHANRERSIESIIATWQAHEEQTQVGKLMAHMRATGVERTTRHVHTKPVADTVKRITVRLLYWRMWRRYAQTWTRQYAVVRQAQAARRQLALAAPPGPLESHPAHVAAMDEAIRRVHDATGKLPSFEFSTRTVTLKELKKAATRTEPWALANVCNNYQEVDHASWQATVDAVHSVAPEIVETTSELIEDINHTLGTLAEPPQKTKVVHIHAPHKPNEGPRRTSSMPRPKEMAHVSEPGKLMTAGANPVKDTAPLLRKPFDAVELPRPPPASLAPWRTPFPPRGNSVAPLKTAQPARPAIPKLQLQQRDASLLNGEILSHTDRPSRRPGLQPISAKRGSQTERAHRVRANPVARGLLPPVS